MRKRNLSKKKYRRGMPKGIPTEYVRLHCIHEAAHTVVAAVTPGAQVGPIVEERDEHGYGVGVAKACISDPADQRAAMFLLAGHLAWARESRMDPWECLAVWQKLEHDPGDDLPGLAYCSGSEEELLASVQACQRLLEENWKAVRGLGEEYMARRHKGLTHRQVQAFLRESGVKIAEGVVFTPNPQPRPGPSLP